MTDITVSAHGLNTAIRAILAGAGSHEREQKLVADHLVLANLTGHDSHGVGMLPNYIASAREGRHRVNGKAELVDDAGALLTFDGGTSYGQVVAFEAMEIAIERVRRHGVAVVSIRNSNHVGRIGHWAEQCAASGYVSIHFCCGFANRTLVAPFGGTDARFGTNPFCAGFPRPGDEPIILDFATSKIAAGKVRVAMNKGETLPEEVLLDAKGKPTTDPKQLYVPPTGALLPIGGHKGYGLAFICELFGGALSGGGTWTKAKLGRRVNVNNMFSIVVDPQRLGGRDVMAEEARNFAEWVKASPPADGVEIVLLPGEPERQRKKKRLADGIPIDTNTWNEVIAAAESVGVPRTEIAHLVGVIL
ncbi:MAG: malate/lactate/ureidoglycolate dehydrogenase [Alphaproteobacteria bacterium]|nr:malate/lactate/ureidoglycolate dehydrogenase [Alphaproteobacteria bacterium]